VLKALLTADGSVLTPHTPDEWLRACAGVMVLEIVDERWRFAHDKLREGVLAKIAANADEPSRCCSGNRKRSCDDV
jgi:hypothetical protein